MKVDKKVLRRVVKVLLHKVPKEEEKLLKVASDLELLSTLYKRSAEFRNLILDPKMNFEKKKEILEKIAEKLDLDKNVTEALIYIAKIKKGPVLKELAKAFNFEIEKFFGTIKGEIITAFPIEEEEIKEIRTLVESKLGKKVEFEVKEDKSIIGGLIIKAGSYIVDGSVKTFMQKLAQQLTKA